MKNKGFTLIEMLGVVIVLSLLSIFIIPGVVNLLSSKKDDVIDVNGKLIYNAAKLYISDNNSDSTCISIDTLVDEGYLESPVKYENNDNNKKEILNNRDDKLKYSIKINSLKDNNQKNLYEIVLTSKC